MNSLPRRRRVNKLFAFLAVASAICSAQSEDPLRTHYEAAAQFATSGDRAHASAEYRAFLAEALHRVGNGKADTGEFESAEQSFDESLRFAPDDRSLKLDFAKACLDADKLPKARELTEQLLNSPDPSPDIWLLHARVLFHLGEFQSSQAELKRVFAAKPEFNTGYLLSKTYLLLHNEKEARRLFDRMAQMFGDTAQTHVYFGRAYGETDHRDEAIEEFHRAMTRNSRAPDVHYYLALTYLGHNEVAGYAQAIPEFRAELQQNPDDFRSHYMLGYIALKQRDFLQAETELKQALALRPMDLQSALQLAELYDDTNRRKEEEDLLRGAISASSERVENEGQVARAHYLLGRLLEQSGRHQEALQEMAVVSEIQRRLGPSSSQTTDIRTKEAEDESRRARNVQPEKIKQLEQFISGLRPAIANAYNNLGVISASDGDFSVALNDFQNASAWDPSLEGLDRNLGRAAFLMGNFTEASQVLARYVSEHPDDSSARSTLGLAWFKLGEYQKVVNVLQPIAGAISSNPELANAYSVALEKTKKN